jgi:uncharacterized protein (DUF849 family)
MSAVIDSRYSPSVITAAVTGGDVLPSQSPAIPRGAQQIAAEAVAAGRAGAAAVHLHARDSAGRPSSDPEIWKEIGETIRAQSDVVINVTTGGSPGMTIEQRLSGVLAIKPELATLNLGTMNYEGFPDPARWPKVESQWERDVLEQSGSGTFVNTLSTLRHVTGILTELGVIPELEAYDLGHLSMARFLIDEGTLRPPVRVQLVLGVLGGASAALEELFVLRERAHTILGTELATLSVAGLGYPAQLRHAAVALSLGMDCRVGMEDNLRVRRDRRAQSNAELVEVAARLAEAVGRPLASSQDLRAQLSRLTAAASR